MSECVCVCVCVCVCACCLRMLFFLDGLQNGPEEVQDGAWLCEAVGREVALTPPVQGNTGRENDIVCANVIF